MGTPANPNKFTVLNQPSAIDGTGAFAGEAIPAYKKIGAYAGEDNVKTFLKMVDDARQK